MTTTRIRAALTAATLGGALAAGQAAAQSPSTAVQTVDTMNTLWGSHHLRANHAKGIVTEGSFTPSPAAASLSKAWVFAGGMVPVTVRFSDSTGVPTLADGAPAANPHGLSIKFHQTGQGDVDVVTNSLGIFPVATGEDFLALLQANAATKPDSPHPTPIETFVAAHPSVTAAFSTVHTPTSFARETYNGVDAFIFVNAAGARQPFRFKFEPVEGVEHLSEAEAKTQPADFLVDELPKRLAGGPVSFHVLAQLAAPGDQTKDPTEAWAPERPFADLGTLTVTKAVADNAAAEKALRYLPNRLTPGIEVSDDPLIDARVRSYVISFGRRG